MNGAHDLGGMHGLGPVGQEADEPVFHAEWERRCFGVTIAAGFMGEWNIDTSRFARETMHPAEYLSTSYYEHWLHGLERLLVDCDLATAEEVAQGRALRPGRPVRRVLKAADVPATLGKGGSARRPDAGTPRFAPGQAVIARNINPPTHTRVPRYVRGRRGIVERVHGTFVFPDTNAHGQGEKPQWCYAVRFDGRELWGPDAEPGTSVLADLWDDHLDAA